MEKVKLSESLSVSRIVHGYMRMNDWNMSSKELLSFIKATAELGITTVDHADLYGDYTVEEQFGRALELEPQMRKQIEIITKCGIKLISDRFKDNKVKHYDTSKEHIINSVETSLKNLKTDYIDLLMIHRPDPFMNPDEVAEAFNQLKQEGKVLNFAVSNFSESDFSMLQSYLSEPLVTNQVRISPLYLDAFHDGTINHALKERIHPMAWSPLGGGRVFRENTDQAVRVRNALKEVGEEINCVEIDKIAYAWLLNHPAKIIPIVGSRNIEVLQRAKDSLNLNLSREQWFKIYEASQGESVK